MPLKILFCVLFCSYLFQNKVGAQSFEYAGDYMSYINKAYEKWLAKQKGPVVSEPAASNLFKAQNHKDGTQQALSDAYTRSISDITLKNIQQDIYIEEAYQIMIDLINMHTKNSRS